MPSAKTKLVKVYYFYSISRSKVLNVYRFNHFSSIVILRVTLFTIVNLFKTHLELFRYYSSDSRCRNWRKFLIFMNFGFYIQYFVVDIFVLIDKIPYFVYMEIAGFLISSIFLTICSSSSFFSFI